MEINTSRLLFEVGGQLRTTLQWPEIDLYSASVTNDYWSSRKLEKFFSQTKAAQKERKCNKPNTTLLHEILATL